MAPPLSRHRPPSVPQIQESNRQFTVTSVSTLVFRSDNNVLPKRVMQRAILGFLAYSSRVDWRSR